MYRTNFCAECGERLARKGWRAFVRGRFCPDCARRLGAFVMARPVAILLVAAITSFGLGKYLRPKAPPLLIQRAANSPLSDLPVNLNDAAHTASRKTGSFPNQNASTLNSPPADERAYICGARTKKGTPCHRRVHVAGERCFQHKGLTAMLPLEKLEVKQ